MEPLGASIAKAVSPCRQAQARFTVVREKWGYSFPRCLPSCLDFCEVRGSFVSFRRILLKQKITVGSLNMHYLRFVTQNGSPRTSLSIK